MRITIESRFHGTKAQLRPRLVGRKWLVSTGAFDRAVARCCPGRASGACRCPITLAEEEWDLAQGATSDAPLEVIPRESW